MSLNFSEEDFKQRADLLEQKTGYRPKNRNEADDLEQEMEYWNNYEGGKSRCLIVFLLLFGAFVASMNIAVRIIT